MEAKSQAPVEHLRGLEEQNQKWEERWNKLGIRIEDALEDIAGYRMLNHDLQFASEKNTELRQKNSQLALKFGDYKIEMENTI